MQNLVHVKPAAVFALDLRKGDAIAAVVDAVLECPRAGRSAPAQPARGWHGPRKLGVFEWPLASIRCVA